MLKLDRSRGNKMPWQGVSVRFSYRLHIKHTHSRTRNEITRKILILIDRAILVLTTSVRFPRIISNQFFLEVEFFKNYFQAYLKRYETVNNCYGIAQSQTTDQALHTSTKSKRLCWIKMVFRVYRVATGNKERTQPAARQANRMWFCFFWVKEISTAFLRRETSYWNDWAEIQITFCF